MNENQKFEFVTALLLELANTTYIEMLSPTDKLITISNSKDLSIKIKQVNDLAELTAYDTKTQATINIPISSLTSLLERLGMLDKKLESKLEFVFSEKKSYIKNPELIKQMIESRIDSTFPELKGNVTVQIGAERDEVVLLFKNGFDHQDFKKTFPSLILSKSFFENCKIFGIKKLVFLDEINKTFDDLIIDNFDISRLR